MYMTYVLQLFYHQYRYCIFGLGLANFKLCTS